MAKSGRGVARLCGALVAVVEPPTCGIAITRLQHHEEVGRDQLLRMVGQERTPGLRGQWPAANHVCRDGRLRNGESQFQKFTVNPRRTPEGIRGRHRANQGAYLLRDGRPTRPMAALPRPEETEPAPMPGDDGVGFDDDEGCPPFTPDSGEPDQRSRSTRVNRSRRACDRSRT
jgi:hypothetical protein